MKRKRSIFAVSVIAFLMVSMFLSTNVLAEEITIKGEVNDNYQIVTEDGQIYEVADTDKGNEVEGTDELEGADELGETG